MENLWKTVTENVGFIVVIAITAAVLFAVAKLGEMWAGVTSSQQMRTKKIVTIGMMSALAFILQIFDFPVPFAPPFYKLDFSEVPVLICSFAMGPVAGVASELLKNVLKVLFRGTTTAFVGDYANFVIGCSFIIPAAILYFKHKTKKTAIIGCVAGTIIIAIFGSLFNAFYLLPAFSKLYGMPLESILEMGHAIFSGFEEFNICCLMCSTIKSVKGCTGISYRYADLQANQPYSASGIKIELFFLCIRCKINTMHKISCVCSKCKLQFVCIRSRKAADICFYSTTCCSDKNETIFGGINGNTRKNL